MLTSALGAGPKAFLNATFSAGPASALVAVLPFILQSAGKRRGVLLVSKTASLITVVLTGAGLAGAKATVLDGTTDGVTVAPEPGFVPPTQRNVGADGALKLGPYAIGIVWAASP